MLTSQGYSLPVSSVRWSQRNVLISLLQVPCKAAVISWLFKLLSDMHKLNAWESVLVLVWFFFN